MVYVVLLGVFVLVVALMVHLVTDDRHSKMTEEEFEAEARRSPAIGSALMEIQKIPEPSRRVEYMLQRDKKVEADGAESGDGPSTDDRDMAPRG